MEGERQIPRHAGAGLSTPLRSGPNEQTKSVVPHLRRSIACLWTQPFRAGLIFGAGPLGLDCKHRFPMFIPPLPCRQASRLLEMTNHFEGSSVFLRKVRGTADPSASLGMAKKE